MQFKRGKRKILADYSTPDIYKYYKENTDNPVDKATFTRLVKEYNYARIYSLIYYNTAITLPGRLGSIIIRRKKSEPIVKEDGTIDKRFMAPDWKKTKEYWKNIYPNKTEEEITKIPNKKIIYHLNEHTDGYMFYFYWDKITSNVKNQSAYRIKMTRTNKRELRYAAKMDKSLTSRTPT